MAASALLLPETLEHLTAQEASALRGTRRGLGWLWRNATLRSLKTHWPQLAMLRRLEIAAEALEGVKQLPGLSSLQELSVQHLLVPAVQLRPVLLSFLQLLAASRLTVLELPDLLCAAGARDMPPFCLGLASVQRWYLLSVILLV